VVLAIFDLDNTLIGDDSDYLWGQFLVERGIVDKGEYEQANAAFYAQYRAGTLNIAEFLHFALRPLAAHEPERLYRWREAFIEEKIRPVLLPAARELLDKHRRLEHVIVVITATNRFVTEPIVALYGIEHLVATAPEMRDGRYTGNFIGIPCYQAGKVERLRAWMAESGHDLNGSWFYSDSRNDIPLLSLVEHPVAVDPDDVLRRWAETRGCPIISLRDGRCPDHHTLK
jgi:HAD superfamily hydrolase (TIGR01490 family)